MRTVKIRLHPHRSGDGIKLRQLFGIARWTYNEAVKLTADTEANEERKTMLESKKWKNPSTGLVEEKSVPISWLKFLRQKVVNNDSAAVVQHPWLKELGYDIRDAAVKEVLAARKAAFTQKKNGNIETFELKKRSRKRCGTEALELRSRYIEQLGYTVVQRLPNQRPMHLYTGRRAFRTDFPMDCKLLRGRLNEYYLCVPMPYDTPERALRVENQDPSRPLRVCALDPGVRTFQTLYDGGLSEAVHVGDGDMKGIMRLCYALDKLISRQQKAERSRERCSLRRASFRIRRRIRNMVDEVHKQLAKHLASQYDLVLIPVFEVSRMVRRLNRKIGSKTVRQMACWGHFRFRERLSFKCRQLGAKLVVVNESYTSKTCSCCGYEKTNLGGSKVFRCDVVMDRDDNAAKNILLRNAEAVGLEVSSGLTFGAYPLSSGDG